ncbi:conjugative transfer pilus assembly protein TraH [Desulfacinum hydrothermale DSM 13146]|uniref:Conjugative transfer pilus assembly protein TraH n=1 Tax=Desulfacinum hydrothermale DSM 13146 TaxID=1121390 RepID=A0A1W1XX90_9BACT|nr:conjugal transfer protein TraH [Desulfacinum hydrothermale]SMC28553.1 conjugative transfer pilus assembly protein TraH [Desulfacinum hydrothermale DSM 13146]
MFRVLHIIVCLSVVLTASFSFPVRAGSLEDALNSMFSTAAGEPQVYESQRRGGLVGGYFSAKAPVKSINVINFAAPRIDAGCGGIDMFFGSFSFLNAQELQQLIRAIGANAVGYAFKSAIQAMCGHCAAVLNDLEAKINALNRNLKNTCSLAHMVVDTFNPISTKNKADETGNLIKASKNTVSDVFESIMGLFSNPQSSIEDSPEANPNAGNLIWKALWETGAAGIIGDPRSAYSPRNSAALQMAQYLMSMTGTVIVPVTPDPNTTDCSGSERCSVRAVPFGPILSFRALVDGSDEYPNATYYRCDNTDGPMSCQHITEAAFTFEGIKQWVDTELDAIISATSNGVELTGQQQYLISIIPLPILRYLMDVQSDAAMMSYVKQFALDMIVDSVAVNLGHAIIMAAQNAFNGVDDVSIPQSYYVNLDSLRKEVSKYERSMQDRLKINNELEAMVRNLRANQITPIR